jgi:septal ring-binding cell division protein DamX
MGEDTDSRDTGEDVGPPRAKGDWKQQASTGILLAAVLAILAAGALLRGEKSVEPRIPPLPKVPTAAAVEPAPSPAIATEVAPAAPVEIRAAAPLPAPAGDLGQRAAHDWKRLSSRRGGFTAQMAVTCKEDNTRRILKKAGSSERLFLVALPSKGPTCFRVCWGSYPSANEAAAARDLPASLRKDCGRPSARPIAEIEP